MQRQATPKATTKSSLRLGGKEIGDARARGPEEAALRLPETAETALAAMTALAMCPALPRPLFPIPNRLGLSYNNDVHWSA